MNRRTAIRRLATFFLTTASLAHAQQPKKVPRIGYLSAIAPAAESTRSEGVRLALRERGYIEGQNIATEYRYAEGKPDHQPELAAELVRLKVDMIVVAGGFAQIRRPRMRPRRFRSLWWALGSTLSTQA
jgi:putative ABC transport system substrate-binding protein